MSFGARVAMGRMASGFGNRFTTLFKGFGSRVSGAISSIKQFIKCPIPEACASPLSQNFGIPVIANQALEKQVRFGPVQTKQMTPPRARTLRPKEYRAQQFGRGLDPKFSFAREVY